MHKYREEHRMALRKMLKAITAMNVIKPLRLGCYPNKHKINSINLKYTSYEYIYIFQFLFKKIYYLKTLRTENIKIIRIWILY